MAVSKPPVTRVSIPSNKYTRGRSARISQVSEHHVVGDARHVIAKAQGSAIFSTTYTIGMDGTIYQLVDDANTPYCDNDFRSNSRSITIEHAGGLAGFPYTEAMYQSSIRLHAWLFQTYGNLNCVRHRDIPEIKATPSKATACPGGLDVERIVREAYNLLKGEDLVQPSEAEVYDIFRRFSHAGKPENPDQVRYYMNRDIRDLYRDILLFEVQPKDPEIVQAFKDFQPWTPLNTPPYEQQSAYYAERPSGFMYRDLALGLKRKLDEKPPVKEEFEPYNGKPLFTKK